MDWVLYDNDLCHERVKSNDTIKVSLCLHSSSLQLILNLQAPTLGNEEIYSNNSLTDYILGNTTEWLFLNLNYGECEKKIQVCLRQYTLYPQHMLKICLNDAAIGSQIQRLGIFLRGIWENLYKISYK